ncbi:MAG: proton-conducting transporter membrane subunit, partial [Firmicutes bacterium]|nr:proton-conducting transporter membrane subunit [Bacillota bacterium]
MDWLLGLVGMPLIGAVVSGSGSRQHAKKISGGFALATLILFIGLLTKPSAHVNWPWIPMWGVRFDLASNGLALFLMGMTAVVTIAAIWASNARYSRSYYFWVLFLEFAMMGLFAAADLVLFYVFWEALLIPVFFLLVGWGGTGGRSAAMKWLIVNLIGSLFMLVGIIGVAVNYVDSGRHLTFQITQLSTLPLGPSGMHWMIFGAFLLAMAIKA